MIIRCEECGAGFRIDEGRIKPTGSKVRCSKCGHIFRVFRPHSNPEERGARSGSDEDSNVEIISGKTRFPQVEERDMRDSPSYTTPLDKSGTPISSTSKSGGMKSRGVQDGKEDSWYQDVGDKVRMRTAKPPAIGTRVPAKVDEEGAGEAVGDDEEHFSWESLELGGEISDPEGADAGEPPDAPSDPYGRATEGSGGFGFEEGVEEEQVPDPNLYAHEGLNYESPPSYHDERREPEDDPLKERYEDGSNRTTRQRGGTEAPFKSPNSYVRTRRVVFAPYGQPSAGKSFNRVFGLLVALVIVVAMLVAGAIIVSNSGIMPKRAGGKLVKALSSVLHIGVGSKGGEDVVVKDNAGVWLSTTNGYIFVVSGLIKNQSRYIVNYVQITSEFMGGGEKLYTQVAYAGNTFAEDELKTMSIEEIEERLNRRNGDIDFRNPEKLAGLNYGLKPNETIPFFAVFPSENKVLGLRYRVWVSDFERGPEVREFAPQ